MITVITAVFNRQHSLKGALDSLASQSWPAWQHVVMDGGSTDGTVEILARYHSEKRIVFSAPDKGIYDALNKGFGHATGEIIGLLHSDDQLADEHVLATVAAAFEDPAVDAVYGDLVYVSAQDPQQVVRYWKAAPFSRTRMRWGWMPPHPTLFLRRRVVEAVGLYDTTYRIAADYDYILRCFSRPGFKAIYIPHVLVRMRLGGESNRSLSRIWRKTREDLFILRRNRVGGIGALVWKNLSKVGQFFRRG